MAYDANKHTRFSQRMRNWMREINQLYIEAGAIDDIYTNEAASGADAAFVTNDIATKTEYQDAINLLRRHRDMLAFDAQTANITSADQISLVTPFLQT